jgi:hypothetical protein
MPNSQHTPDSAHGPHDAPLTKASRRLLKLSLGTPRPCPWVRQWRHRVHRRERMLARAHAQAKRA